MTSALLRPARIPEHIYTSCSYFLPRLLFLNSAIAAQVHWGDITAALHDFPVNLTDLSSTEFWDEWMRRWKQVGDSYMEAAELGANVGASQFFRSAAACYHWAEFMYFSDVNVKTGLRRQVKSCFSRSLEGSNLKINTGDFFWNSVRVPYYLIFPKTLTDPKERIPCVILSNGLDSVTEVEIFAFAEHFLARGMAVFLFDGPGQGINVGLNPIEIQFERVVSTILQQLIGEPHIDNNRLGFFGVSFGGYFALRVAKYLGEQFQCVVNYSGGPFLSPFADMPRRLKEDFSFAFMESDAKCMQTIFEELAFEMSGPLRTDVLSIHGGRDDIFPIAGLKLLDEAFGKKHTLQIYPSEAHVCLNYLNRNSVQIADWTASKLFTNGEDHNGKFIEN